MALFPNLTNIILEVVHSAMAKFRRPAAAAICRRPAAAHVRKRPAVLKKPAGNDLTTLHTSCVGAKLDRKTVLSKCLDWIASSVPNQTVRVATQRDESHLLRPYDFYWRMRCISCTKGTCTWFCVCQYSDGTIRIRGKPYTSHGDFGRKHLGP